MSRRAMGAGVPLAVAGCLLIGRALPAQTASMAAPIDSALNASIMHLLEASDFGVQLLKAIEVQYETQKAANPEMPEVFWEELFAQAQERLPEFLEMLVPVYAEHLTREDVDGIATFLETPLGRRWVAASSETVVETMLLAEQWGVIVAGEVMVDLARRGVLLQ